jgi:hypothetical protein
MGYSEKKRSTVNKEFIAAICESRRKGNAGDGGGSRMEEEQREFSIHLKKAYASILNSEAPAEWSREQTDHCE